MLAAAITRIEARVSSLAGRIYGAADFARLMATNDIRSIQGGAYVLSMSLRGGQARAATGAFVQDVEEGLSIVLVQRSEDPRAIQALATIEAQRDAVIAGLLGWAPHGEPGPMRLSQGRMINVGAGLLVFQIDFAVATQLRINPS